MRRAPTVLALLALLALASAPALAQPTNTYTLDGSPSTGGVTFDGIGASFAGAAARMLFEYDAPTQHAYVATIPQCCRRPMWPLEARRALLLTSAWPLRALLLLLLVLPWSSAWQNAL